MAVLDDYAALCSGSQAGYQFKLHKLTRTVNSGWFYLQPQTSAEVDVRTAASLLGCQALLARALRLPCHVGC